MNSNQYLQDSTCGMGLCFLVAKKAVRKSAAVNDICYTEKPAA